MEESNFIPRVAKKIKTKLLNQAFETSSRHKRKRRRQTISFQIPHPIVWKSIADEKTKRDEPLTGLSYLIKKSLKRQVAEEQSEIFGQEQDDVTDSSDSSSSVESDTEFESSDESIEKNDPNVAVYYHKLPEPEKKIPGKPKTTLQKSLTDLLSGSTFMKDFIETMKSSKDDKFIYLTLALDKSHINFHPYCYKVVHLNGVDRNNFLTMSKRGVTFHSGGQSEFFPMDDWERDYEKWLVLSNMKTFKEFQMNKCFLIWRRKITKKKFHKRRAALESKLLYARPRLRNVLQRIQVVCYALSAMSFFDAESCDKSTLDSYVKHQVAKLEKTLKLVQEGTQLIKELLDGAAHSNLMAAGFVPDDSNKIIVEGKSVSIDLAMLDVPDKEIKYKMTYAEQRAKKMECIKITRTICLADYLVQTLMVTLLHNSINIFNGTLDKQLAYLPNMDELAESTSVSEKVEGSRESKAKYPMFTIEFQLGSDQPTYEPPSEEWYEAVFATFKGWEQAAMKIHPLQGLEDFRPFINPFIAGFQEERLCGYGPRLASVIDGDVNYDKHKKVLIEKFDLNFEALRTYARRFDDIAETTTRNIHLDPEIIAGEISLEKFKELLISYNNEHTLVDSIAFEQALGAFLINLMPFRFQTVPLVAQILTMIKAAIPRLGREKVIALVAESQDSQAYLKMAPVTAANYVEYMAYVDKLGPRVEELQSEKEYLTNLYGLLENFDIPVNFEDLETYRRFTEGLKIIENYLEKAISNKPETLSKFKDQVTSEIDALMQDVGVISSDAKQTWLVDVNSERGDVIEALDGYMKQLQQYLSQAEQFNAYQRGAKVEVTRFEGLFDVINEVKVRQLLWESFSKWDEIEDEWMTCNFNTLDTDEMQQTTASFMKNITSILKSLEVNEIISALKAKIETMSEKLPTIVTLRNPALKPRHWQKIEQLLSYKFSPDKILTLKLLDSLDIYKYEKELAEICGAATSEAALERLLKKVEDTWKSLEFVVLPYKYMKDVYILAGIEEIQTMLDETNINLTTIISSRHVGPIKGRVEDWIRQADVFSKTLDEWMNCQTNWLYLEPIFSAPDIQRQLPVEAKLFFQVDRSWKDIMKDVAKNPLAMPACTAPNLYHTFKKNNSLLAQILKCLEAYLESKRVVFPRFYFLSNEELLEILAQTRNPHAVQPHLRKCFDAINRLEFDKRKVVTDDDKGDETWQPTNDIKAMLSPEGERVELGKGLKARGNVEDWLGKVEESMFFSLWSLMKACIKDYLFKKRTEWVINHASQLIITVSQIMWVRDVHAAIGGPVENRQTSLQKFEDKCFSDLNDLAAMVRGDLGKLQRNVLGALITVDVHARDIITTMVQKRVQSVQNFEWIKQLRYYWEKKIDNCVACMASARHVYGYEYLGASGKLVITPLTDKCYLCLMGALQLDLGGAPAGPAGTGKTETTKDLAKSLAIQCVVFNCSEGLDYKMMGRFFSGLAQSGAWCCFDEFNRIDIEVLSVIAQQLITIRKAKAAKLKRFMFEGREIKLVPQCAAFITMNPGYAGRTELPDNLKSLFRPMAMMVPDYGLIAEVILYSEGFESSKMLAQKMVNMYKLCSEQLSHQDHYDFGMRAVKSVLVMAGSLKRQNPDKVENVVLIRALRDSNLPKFLTDDAVLFGGILNDLFPNVEIPSHDYGIFQSSMELVLVDMKLQPEPCTFLKTIQLYETMVVRHGVMTVGPTGGGKTTILHVLKNTLIKLAEMGVDDPYYRPVTTYTLNPKSVTMGELYGEVNLTTMEWKDGLLGIFTRTAVNCAEERHQWIVCDGPVDAVWIENMNTVLDDNKMLCLANSERIKLTAWVHMVFEVQDLAQASPATVSRCGMVYVDPNDLKWLPSVLSWGLRLKEEGKLNELVFDHIFSLFKTYVERGFTFIETSCQVGMHQVEISKVAMLCSLLKSILTNVAVKDELNDPSVAKNICNQVFLFSYLWSLGGNLAENSRESFEKFVRESLTELTALPPDTNLWEIFFDVTTRDLQPWSKITPPFAYSADEQFSNMIVPTIDTVRFGTIMSLLIDMDHPVLFTGKTGVGKSVIAREVLVRLSKTGLWNPATLNFSAQTSSARTQEIIESKLERKRKHILGAPIGKRVVIFVDDVNMPKLETYGAQPPVELLRQFLDFKGLYDREKLFWKEISNVVLCAACAPPGGGRNPLTPRFMRHFGLLFIPFPDDPTLQVIFHSIIEGFFEDFAAPVAAIGENLVKAAVQIYNKIAEDLLPTPAKSHYVFNLRDLSKCIQGVLQADSGTLRQASDMHRLFFHENLRVYHDRLVDAQDKSYFYRLVQKVCVKTLEDQVLELPTHGIIQEPPTLLFGDFLLNQPKENRIYEEITNIDKLKNVLAEFLADYNLMRGKGMKLIFFMDAMEHICRLARILRAERGNGLLVGVGGMGKQSLTRLSSHINACRDYQIEISLNYDYNSFHEDLRKIYFSAGAKYEDSVFLFTDTQIVQEEFLEDINNILNSGEVPNLFEGDEYEKVIIACRGPTKQAGLNDNNRDTIFDYFIQRVKSKLHLVICMSPVGDAFRRRCRMFPSLVNCCTIDWFTIWPEEALISVAINTLQEIVQPELVEPMASICNTMHSSVEKMTVKFYNEMRRYYYVTPSSYLDLLKLYKGMLKLKSDQITYLRNRISNGLKKLFETNELVADMQQQLIEMEPILKVKSEATAKLMTSVIKEKAAADEVRQVVLEDEKAAKEIATECQSLADDAQKDLDLAMPAMEAAVKALEALNKKDLSEIRVFIKPPHLVKYVMEAVCLLLGAKQDWASAKVVLSDPNFLKKLQEYDKDNVNDALMKKLKTYIDNEEFMPDIVAAQSRACKSLCMWVRAIDTYVKVYRVVEPKKKKVEAAEKELNSIMSVLRAKQQKLADVEGQIAKLEERYDSSLQEKNSLEGTIDLCAARLDRAGRLTSALSDEQIRWEQLVIDLGEELTNVVGDVLIAAGSIAYLGPFTSSFRDELCSIWLKMVQDLQVPASSNFSLIDVLADPYEIRLWNSCGLPRDKVSIENGIFVTKTNRWPLMIDPQEQANRWIRQMEADNNLRMVKMTDQGFMRVLETAIKLGLPVLIWEVGETLDPSLTPVLLKQIFVQGGRQVIRLGDSDVEYDSNFKLYITTKLPNPHYLPEVCIQVTIVNFTVTPSGLEDQLLVEVVSNEKPQLESARTELIVKINKDKSQLKELEDKILRLLFASKGNILDDEELVETLNISKETSEVIQTRLAESEETEQEISVAREVYRSVATRGSCLYFVVSQLSDIDPMYQFSLKYFNMIFNTVISSAPQMPDLESRLQRLIDDVTLSVYTNVSRGLFEKDKLVYSFLVCISILKNAHEIDEDDWHFLLRGPLVTGQEYPKKPDMAALSDVCWQSVCFLEHHHKSFNNLSQCVNTQVLVTLGDYSYTIALGGPDSRPCPIDFNNRLTLFEKMMLLKSMKEEKVVFAISEFVKLKLGKPFIESPIVNLHNLYEDTSKITPLVFVLSTGSDPVAAFLRFAEETGNRDKVNSISLGQGQGPIAQRMIEKGRARGDWVFLQNCHLASSWMLTLETIVMNIGDNPSEVHDHFRLFFSSMPSKSFPVSVLQNSVKATNEPPKGIRANLKRAFLEIQDDFFNDHPLDSKWRRMIFGLCFFHAVILERKKFGPLGWNILYEFSESDRECALLNLQLFCQSGKYGIPWDALMYITGEVTYGGRVTDYWDQRTLKTILAGFFSPPTLASDYVYSSSGTYHCPESLVCNKIDKYREFIEQFPLIEEPEIFGMHENANIAFQTKETAAILVTIMEIQPKEAGGSEGKSSDEIVFELAELIGSKIAKKIDTNKMHSPLKERDHKGRLPSLSTVLLQETDRFNKLLRVIHTSLKDLQKAIKGLVVMSDALEDVYKAFLNNVIPRMWQRVSYPSLKSLGSWTRDLELRIDFIDTWVRFGLPPSFWLSGFFFPQGFMTGVLQTHARKYDFPIDQLKVDFTVRPQTIVQEDVMAVHTKLKREDANAYSGVEQPEDGVLVHGLFLDAARFDSKSMILADPFPGEINPPLPVMALVPVAETPSHTGRYEAPLYKTSARAGVLSTTGHSTNFVITVLLPTTQPQSYWILKGTALLTQVTD